MGRRIIIVTAVVAALFLAAHPSAAETSSSQNSYGRDCGYGMLAVVTNFLYMPAKLVYATVGGVTGALAYVLTVGNSDVAQSILSPSLGGSYVVTPAMLRGEEELLFNGPSYEGG